MCRVCDGLGWLWWRPKRNDYWTKIPCENCKGTGETPLQDEKKADKPDKWYNIYGGMWS